MYNTYRFQYTTGEHLRSTHLVDVTAKNINAALLLFSDWASLDWGDTPVFIRSIVHRGETLTGDYLWSLRSPKKEAKK